MWEHMSLIRRGSQLERHYNTGFGCVQSQK